MNKEDLEKILEKSRKMFLLEARNKLSNNFVSFLGYYTAINDGDRFSIENFFHSIKGMSSISGFNELADEASQMEKFMLDMKGRDSISPNEVLQLFHGYSRIWDNISILTQTYLSEPAEAENIQELLNKTVASPSLESKVDEKHLANILIVDDDALVLDLLNKYLSGSGYKVFITSRPQEVLDIIQTKKIDLVLMDVMLPTKSGFELFQNIKESNFSGGLIFLSSKNLSNDKLSGLKMGADDYITKPFNMEELLVRVQKVINQNSTIKTKSSKDPLTNVYAREYFYENFKRYISEGKDQNLLFSVALIDIDHFRVINKENGYFIGDLVLKRFAQFLQNAAPDANVYRFEGDKFIVVFKNVDSPDAYYNVLGMLDDLGSRKFDPINKPLTFSSAICTIKNPEEDLENTITVLYETLEKSKGFGDDKITIMNSSQAKPDRIKILIVEDLSVTVYLIKKHLEKFNCDIYHSSDGVDAINKAKELAPDILLLDLMLPKMDGFEVCKRIKDDPNIRNTKIIVVSSKNSEEDVMRCYQMGIDDFISKPFSMTDLEKRIKRLF